VTILPRTHPSGGDAMKRYLLTVVFLAGCGPIVSDNPGTAQSELNVDQAQCQLSAKGSEGDSAAACAPHYCNYCACAPFTGARDQPGRPLVAPNSTATPPQCPFSPLDGRWYAVE
jgi:hypothetical protein